MNASANFQSWTRTTTFSLSVCSVYKLPCWSIVVLNYGLPSSICSDVYSFQRLKLAILSGTEGTRTLGTGEYWAYILNLIWQTFQTSTIISTRVLWQIDPLPTNVHWNCLVQGRLSKLQTLWRRYSIEQQFGTYLKLPPNEKIKLKIPQVLHS